MRFHALFLIFSLVFSSKIYCQQQEDSLLVKDMKNETVTDQNTSLNSPAITPEQLASVQKQLSDLKNKQEEIKNSLEEIDKE